MQLGAEAVFVGSGIFKSDDPAPRAKAIVEATTHFRDAPSSPRSAGPSARPMTGIGMDELERAPVRAGLVIVVVRARRPRVRPPSRRARPAGAFAAHARALTEARRPTGEVRTPRDLERRRRARHAGRRVDDDVVPAQSSGLFDVIAERWPTAMPGVRHVRRHDPACRPKCSTAGPTSARFEAIDIAVRRNGLRPPGRQLRGRPRRAPELERAPFHGVFIRRPRRGWSDPDVDRPRQPTTVIRVLARQARHRWQPVPP